MSIYIKDILRLNTVKELIPLTDSYGFERSVTTVGLLDHELIEGHYEVFKKGEFVLSTLSLARDDSRMVFKALKALIKRQASGLAIKSIYYNNLPDDIIEFSKLHDFPIFVFNDIYMEDIIHSINQALNSRLIHNIYESKIESLLSNQITHHIYKQIVSDLNPLFHEYHQVYYLKEKQYTTLEKIMDYCDTFKKDKTFKHHSLFRFRSGLLVVLTYDSINASGDFKSLMHIIGLKTKDYYIGSSNYQSDIMDLHVSIDQALIANQSSQIKNEDILSYKDLGFYKMVIPMLQETWAIDFAENLLNPIIDYDQKYDTHLYKTLKVYFENKCQTKVASEKLFQHKNTVLYRLNKVKEIIGPFNSDVDFTTQVSLAIAIKEGLYQSPDYK